MPPKRAQLVFIVLNVLAWLAMGYLGYDIFRVEQAIQLQEEIIPYDSGISFLSLSSVFWLFSLIQFLGLRNSDSIIIRRANAFILAWFVATLIIAYSIPQLQKSRFNKANYIACDNPKSVPRVSRGESLIYVRLTDERQNMLAEGSTERFGCALATQTKL